MLEGKQKKITRNFEFCAQEINSSYRISIARGSSNQINGKKNHGQQEQQGTTKCLHVDFGVDVEE